MRNNGSRRGTSKKERDYIEYEGGRMTRNGLSANHLLNFSLPEREKQQQHAHNARKKKSGPQRTQMEYLHANYRFVIAPLTDDAAVSCWDIEKLTEWNSVEQVLLWCDESDPATCPICLDTLRAPKITRCGHVFCWPCILRYLSLSDKYWRRCPMCFDSVQKGQLRSVKLESVQLPPRVDVDATFQFLQRPKASLFPHLRGREELHAAAFTAIALRKSRVRKLPTVYDAEATFARILESTQEYLTQLVLGEMRDLEALDAECRSCGDADTLPFVEEAMKATSGRLAAYDAKATTATPSPSTQQEHGTRHENSKYQSLNGLGPSDLYSFYQQRNGCYVVLHPLNMKCLTKEFAEQKTKTRARKPCGQHKEDEEDHGAVTATTTATTADVEESAAVAVAAVAAGDAAAGDADEHAETWAGAASSPPSSLRLEPEPSSASAAPLQYELLPDTIQGKVVDVEHLVMDDEVQKRYRFLSHLPKFCDFYVCELDLTAQLSAETLQTFRSELKKREKQRRLKKDGDKKSRNRNGAAGGASGASSPVFKQFAMPAFSLDGGESHWPAPSEMSLADMFDEGLQLSEADSAAVAAALASPPLSYQPDSDASFATITRNSGYYPPLGGSSSSSGGGGGQDVTSSPIWGATAPPLAWSPPPPGTGNGGKKKGGAMKKGTQLFSTSQRRSYR